MKKNDKEREKPEVLEKASETKKKRRNDYRLIRLAVGAAALAGLLFCAFYIFAIDRAYMRHYGKVGSLFFIVFLSFLFLFFYEKYVTKSVVSKLKPYLITLTASIFTLFLSTAFLRYLNLEGAEFFLPLALLFLVTAAVLESKTAVLTLFLNSAILLFVIIDSDGVLPAATSLYGLLFNIIGAMSFVFTVRYNYKRINILACGGAVGAAIGAMVFLYALFTGVYSVFASLWAVASSAVSAAAFLALLPLFEKVFDLSTDFRLSEYLTLKNPVLLELREKAPGTYYHSMTVAALAESCAEAIGENPLLARAAAYYHDIGKIKAPEFFSENQLDGYNPHDELIPEVSASKITAHTKDGVEILRSHGFPEEIVRVAEEHHGDTPVAFFYGKARFITEGYEPDTSDYIYDNHKPSGKIAAIIMLCDTVESAARADQSSELVPLIKKLVKGKMDLGQFSECDISFKDLRAIENVLAETMPKIAHTRIKYYNNR